MGLYAFVNEGQIGGDIDLDQVEDYGYEPTLESGFMIAMESEQNYNKFMSAVAIHELNVYAETSEDVIYEAVDIRGFFEKIKEFFKKLFAKVASLVKSFITKFNSLIQNDKEFVKKYGSKILTTKVDTKDFSYKGYEFTHLDNDWSVNKIASAALSYKIAGTSVLEMYNNIPKNAEKIHKFEDIQGGKPGFGGQYGVTQKSYNKAKYNNFDYANKLFAWGEATDLEDAYDAIRGLCVSQNSVESDDFSKELRMYFRNGEDSKVTIDKVEPKDQLNYISNTKDAIKTANTNLKEFKRKIDECIKYVEEDEKAVVKAVNSDDEVESSNAAALLKISNTVSNVARNMLSIVQIANAAYLTAWKDRNRQARAICAKLVSYRTDRDTGKRKLNTESYTGSFLDGVVLK